MNELSLGAPQFLPLMGLVLVVIALIIVGRSKENKLIKSLGAGIERHLAFRWSRGGFFLRTTFFSLGFLCLSLAAAQPRMGYVMKDVSQRGSDIMVLFDVSRSMRASDVSPSRMSRAQRKLADIVSGLRGERLGIVAFAGRAFVHCPLTDDKGMLQLFIDSLSDDLISYQGTNLLEAVKMAVESLEAAQAAESAGKKLVLMTDGEDFSGEIMALRDILRDKKIEISIMGIGTPEGSPIKLSDETFLKDKDGSVVISKLAEKDLIQLAESVDGLYVRSVAGDKDVGAILGQLLGDDPTHQENQEKVWNELFQYAIFLGVLFLILGWLFTPYLPSVPAPILILLISLGNHSASLMNSGVRFLFKLLTTTSVLYLWSVPTILAQNNAVSISYDTRHDAGYSNLSGDKISQGRALIRLIEFNSGVNSTTQQLPASKTASRKTPDDVSGESSTVPSSEPSSKASAEASSKASSRASSKASSEVRGKAISHDETLNGASLFREKKFMEAAGAFERDASNFDPQSLGYFQGLYNAGVAHHEAMNFDEALGAFKKASESNSHELKRDSLFNLGNTLVAQGKLEEAVGYFEKSIGVDGSFTEAKENLRWVMQQLEEKKKANNAQAGNQQSPQGEKNQNEDPSKANSSNEQSNGDSSNKGETSTKQAENSGKPRQEDGSSGGKSSANSESKFKNDEMENSKAGNSDGTSGNNLSSDSASGNSSKQKAREPQNSNQAQSGLGDKKASTMRDGTSPLAGGNHSDNRSPIDAKQSQGKDIYGNQSQNSVAPSKDAQGGSPGSISQEVMKPQGSPEANAILRQIDENLKIWGVKPRFAPAVDGQKDW